MYLYLSQLSLNVFSIRNCKNGKKFLYICTCIYHEEIADDDPDKVTSFLWDDIKKSHTVNTLVETNRWNRFFFQRCHPYLQMIEILE